MTVEETASLFSPFKPHEWQEGYGLYESGFVQGAKWMMLRASSQLLEQGLKTDVDIKTICIEDFIKAMGG